MWKRLAVIVVVAASSSWTLAAQDARTVISAVSMAMGVDTLKTLEFTATGLDFAVGQNANPGVAWPKFIDKSYTRQIDFEKGASRVERIRVQGERPQRGGAQPVVGEQTQVQTVIIDANTPWVQQLEIWMTPHGFLRAAKTNNATLAQQTINGKPYRVLTFIGQNKAKVNGYINSDQLVERVETWIDNPVLGDMIFEANYINYKDFGGVKFPMKMVIKQGPYPILDLNTIAVKPNAAVSIQAAAAAPAQANANTPGAPSQKLADGVFLLLGGYASVAVDFKDYIVIIEGPQSEARATAIINEAKKLIPNKPIKYVVNTHAHYDHAGGLRTFVAEGATIITHEMNKPFYEKMMTLPHTLSPDRLSTSKAKPSFETMTEKKVLTDGNHVIELHHDLDNQHNDAIVFAWLPKEKIVVVADTWSAPQQPDAPTPAYINEFFIQFAANLDRLKIDPETLVGIHYPNDGRRSGKAELLKSLGKVASGAN